MEWKYLMRSTQSLLTTLEFAPWQIFRHFAQCPCVVFIDFSLSSTFSMMEPNKLNVWLMLPNCWFWWSTLIPVYPGINWFFVFCFLSLSLSLNKYRKKRSENVTGNKWKHSLVSKWPIRIEIDSTIELVWAHSEHSWSNNRTFEPFYSIFGKFIECDLQVAKHHTHHTQSDCLGNCVRETFMIWRTDEYSNYNAHTTSELVPK